MIPHIMLQAVNVPLMLLPSKAEIIQSVLAMKDGSPQMLEGWARPLPQQNSMVGEPVAIGGRYAYGRVGATAVVPVIGTMVNRGAYVGADSGLVSYEGVQAQLLAAARDEKVLSILLDVESPGGAATGAFGLSEFVRKVSAEKPVYAFVNGMAASAGYAMVSGARRIYSTMDGYSGSIGVVLLHLDRSAQAEKQGVKPTLIFAGAHKADGNPYQPLSDAVQEDLQALVNRSYEMFVAAVAQGRKGLTADAIRATEARMFMGAEAVKAGLVDAVASFEDVLTDINRAAGRPINRTKGMKSMSTTEGNSAAPSAEVMMSKAELEAVKSAAKAEGVSEGRSATLAGIGAIVKSDEAQGREAQAMELALLGVTPDMAKAMLATSPKASSIAERAAANNLGLIAARSGPDGSGESLSSAAKAESAKGWNTAVTKLNTAAAGAVRTPH